MPFFPPSWVPPLVEIPDVSFDEFMLNESHGRQPFATSRHPFVCGLTGRSYDFETVRQRVGNVASALQKHLAYEGSTESEWKKVVAIYSINCIDYFTAAWAVLKFGGVVTTASIASSASELERQLKHSRAKALFTCYPLLEVAQAACRAAGIPSDRIFILPVSVQHPLPREADAWKEIDHLVDEGSTLPDLPARNWKSGESAKRIAYLPYSSGTSGLPKGVLLTHRTLIANVLQIVGFESKGRRTLAEKQGLDLYNENCLGVAPFSHVYGFAMVVDVPLFRGDSVIVLPKYHLETIFQTIQQRKINILYLVPPMIVDILRSRSLCKKYDLSSVNSVFSAASTLKRETSQQLVDLFPDWAIKQAYGATETNAGVTITSAHDVQFGTCGSLLPGNRARILTPEGNEITDYERRGELLLHGPSVFPGYHENEAANDEIFVRFEDGLYLRTGDEAMIQLSDRGNEHIVITERLKELIKVKGHQVPPADLEACLLTHAAVDDCAVIGVADERSGELPKAFVVKAPAEKTQDEIGLKRELYEYVQMHKSRYMWLDGGIEFVDSVPKSPTGKMLRRLLRDQEKAKQEKDRARL